MHTVTHRVITILSHLEAAAIELDEDFALLLSFHEARALYYDLSQAGSGYEVYEYLPFDGSPVARRTQHIGMPGHLVPPPYPNGKRIIWAQLHGLKIAIKGTEEE